MRDPFPTNRANTALKSLQTAFEAGFRAGLRGQAIGSVYYKSPIFTEAWERGWRKAKQLQEKKS